MTTTNENDGNRTCLYEDRAASHALSSPVVIEQVALHKTEDEKVQLTAGIKSVSDKTIAAVIIDVRTYDIVNKLIDDTFEYQYLDLALSRDEVYGTDKPIEISYYNARRAEVSVSNVVFDDGTMWDGSNAVWEKISAPKPIAELLDEELTEEYEKVSGVHPVVTVPEKSGGLWYCACGAVNREDESCCHTCGAVYDDICNALDQDALMAAAEVTRQEKAEQEARELQAKKEAEEQARLAKEEEERKKAEEQELKKQARQEAAQRAKRKGAAAAGYLTWIGALIAGVLGKEHKEDVYVTSHRNLSLVLNFFATAAAVAVGWHFVRTYELPWLFYIAAGFAAVVLALMLAGFAMAIAGKEAKLPPISNIRLLGGNKKKAMWIAIPLLSIILLAAAPASDLMYCKSIAGDIVKHFTSSEMDLMNLDVAVPEKQDIGDNFNVKYKYKTDEEIADYEVAFLGTDEFSMKPNDTLEALNGTYARNATFKTFEKDGAKATYFTYTKRDSNEDWTVCDAIVQADKSTYRVKYQAKSKYFDDAAIEQILSKYDFKKYKSPKIEVLEATYQDSEKALKGESFDMNKLKVKANYDNGLSSTLSEVCYEVDGPTTFEYGANEYTVKAGKATAQFSITTPTVESLTATYAGKQPYLGNDDFDENAVTVKANLSDGRSIEVDGKVEGPDKLAWGSNTYKVTAEGKETTLKVDTPAATLSAVYRGSTEAGEKVDQDSNITAAIKYTDPKTKKETAIEVTDQIKVTGGGELKADGTVTATVECQGLKTNVVVRCSTESEAKYKASCGTYSYDSLTHNASGLRGKRIKIYGKVLQSSSGVVRIGTSGYGYYDGDVYVTFSGYGAGRDLYEDDMVTIWGECDGTKTYTTVLGASRTVPKISAKYYSR